MKKNISNKSLVLSVPLCFAIIVSAPFEVFALASVEFAIRELCQHMEGNLGGLLMVTAGVGGMISAAFGNMKALYSCVITGIGAFTVSSMLSLYFPKAYGICSGSGGNTARTKIEETVDTKVSGINEISAINSFLKKDSESSQTISESPASLGDEESESELF
jgi:type IV secretory pathway VirB2 component (pilin)